MGIVVATHAAISFMVTPIGWAIQDRSRSLGVDALVWTIRAFIMPLFFWLSGYFARTVYLRGGYRGFIRHRVRRIIAPLALALVPMSIAVEALWRWGAAHAARPEVAAEIPKLEASRLPLTLGHLWYLYYLLIVSAAAIVVVEGSRRTRVRAIDARAIIPVVTAVTVTPLVVAGVLQLDTPLGFGLDPGVALYFAAFFAWGWMVHARPVQLERYVSFAWVSTGAAVLLLATIVPTLLATAHASGGRAPLYAILATGALTVALTIAFLGLCVRYARRRHRAIEAAADASYWTYVVHFPLVILLQIALASVPWPGPVKYLVIVGVTLVTCALGYAAIRAASLIR